MKSNSQRLNGMSIIGAACSKGEFYLTINKGKNNGETFSLFLMKLVRVLDAQNCFWRNYTYLLIDNAPYHKSRNALFTY